MEFEKLNTQVLGISIDHVPCLRAWAESLGGINFPLLSDFWPHGEVGERYGVLRDDGKTERAIFIIDSKGYIRYIDIHDIDDQPSNDVLFEELAKVVQPFPQKEEQKPEKKKLPHGGVVMYCNSWCPDCRKAKSWFEDHGIEYTEVDIPSTPGAAEQVREWANGYMVTPTINVDGVIILDFDEEKLSEVLLGYFN